MRVSVFFICTCELRSDLVFYSHVAWCFCEVYTLINKAYTEIRSHESTGLFWYRRLGG